jgi:hypothetical protein
MQLLMIHEHGKASDVITAVWWMEHVAVCPCDATAETGGRTVMVCPQTEFTGSTSAREMCVKHSTYPHLVPRSRFCGNQPRLPLRPLLRDARKYKHRGSIYLYRNWWKGLGNGTQHKGSQRTNHTPVLEVTTYLTQSPWEYACRSAGRIPCLSWNLKKSLSLVCIFSQLNLICPPLQYHPC